MDNFTIFREYRQRWAGWIGVTADSKIRKNTIWHQCTEMMNNEFMFQALSLAGKKAASHPDFLSFFAANGPLNRYLTDGYFGFQYLAIRRLTDITRPSDEERLRGVASIRRLLDDMQANSPIITREAFVCFDGAPYDYGDILAREEEEWLAKVREAERGVWGGSTDAQHSAQRHVVFDRLSGVSPNSRQPVDCISREYWTRCREALSKPELASIKNFVDKFLAHAADEDSLGTIDDQDKVLSREKIHKAQQSLIGLVQQLTSDFYTTTFAMVPTHAEEKLIFNFSKPFVSADIEGEVYQALQQQKEEMLKTMFT